MAAAIRRDLFLQIGGSAAGITDAAKAAKTVLFSTGETATSVADQIEEAWANLGKNTDRGLKDMERSLTRTMNTFRANAQKVSDAPTPAAATQILNVNGAEQAAKAAEAEAAALRVLADAASALAARAGAAGAEEKILAAALGTQAVEARAAATALRNQANLLGSVATEAGIAGHKFDEAGEGSNRMGASGMIAEHVVRSLSDSIAAGQSPVRALTMEMGRITEAMSLYAQQTNATEGAMGKFASFMGGGWGIALSIGVAVLTPMIADLVENKKSAEDAKKALEEYARFMDDLGNFVDKATGKIIEQNKALIAGAKLSREGKAHEAAQATGDLKTQAFEKARDAAGINTAMNRGDQQSRVDFKLSKVITDAGGDLGKLLGGLKALSAENPHYDNIYRAVLQLGSQAQKSYADYKRLRGEVSELDTVGAGGTVNSSAIVDRHVADLTATTALEKATARLNDTKARGTSIDAMIAGPARDKALQRYEADLLAAQRAVDKAKEDAKTQKKTDADDAQVGRQINLSQAEGIVHGIGGRVTSAERSTAEQQRLYDRYMAYKAGGAWAPIAAKPGTSEHERGQALDVAKGGGMTLAKLVEAFRDQGVHLTERLDEGDHFHVAWGAKGKKGPSQETIDKRAQSAADKATRDAEAYAQLMGRAQEETLKLTRDQVTSRAAIANLDLQEIEAERQRLDGAAQAGADERKWSQAKADELKVQNDINADLKARAIKQAEVTRQIDEQFSTSKDERDARDALLQIDVSMAGTRAERLAAERKLLADHQDQRREDLEKVVADPSTSDDKFQAAEAGLGRLPAQDAAEKGELEDRYKSPMAGYRDELTKNVGDVNDAVQGIEVGGLQSLQENLLAIATGTKSVAAAFRDMAMSIITDIEKIALEKLVLSVIGLKGGGMVPGFAAGGIPGFAAGASSRIDGLIRGPGTGTSDSILAMVGGNKPIRVANGESIVTAAATKKHWPIIKAMNEGRLPGFAGGLVPESAIYMRPLPASGSLARQRDVQVMHIITDKTPLFDTHVQKLTMPMAQAAMIGGAREAGNDRMEDAVSRIPQ